MNLNITPIVLRIVIVNVIVFLFLDFGLLGLLGLENINVIKNQFFVLHKSSLIIHRTYDEGNFLPIQLVTAFFTHGGFFHIFFNMWVLISFGSIIEMVLGAKRFLAFYLFCGVLGSFFTALLDPSPIPVVGASGAIFGVMVAFAIFFPNQRITFFMPFPITMKSRIWMMTIGGLSSLLVVLDALGVAPGITGGISHFGHLAGMVSAIIFFYSGIHSSIK
ncbi:MAG: rhomboid family intramembrane serine protease [Bacteroidia bacterium]|nr:rhomboid family intramembrane serine protease [Bacteroidia bacterium]